MRPAERQRLTSAPRARRQHTCQALGTRPRLVLRGLPLIAVVLIAGFGASLLGGCDDDGGSGETDEGTLVNRASETPDGRLSIEPTVVGAGREVKLIVTNSGEIPIVMAYSVARIERRDDDGWQDATRDVLGGGISARLGRIGLEPGQTSADREDTITLSSSVRPGKYRVVKHVRSALKDPGPTVALHASLTIEAREADEA